MLNECRHAMEVLLQALVPVQRFQYDDAQASTVEAQYRGYNS